jgi:ankyrin repeat protein
LGDTGLFDHIVSRGANPQNSVALHWASKCHDPDKTIAMIDHLLDKQHMNIEANNADFWTVVDAPDVGTPLECAVYYRNLAAVKHFLKRGAQPRGAADISAGRWDVPPFLPALGPLLDGGADPDDALEWVICTNDIEAAKLCVEAGADPRAITSSQRAYAIRRRPVTHPSDMDAFLQSFDHAS